MRRAGGLGGLAVQAPEREVGAVSHALQTHPPCPVAFLIVWEMTSVNICQSETAR
jgi:hypothetical protein